MTESRGKKARVSTRRRTTHDPLRPEQAQATSPETGEESPPSLPTVPKDTYLRLAADFENYKKRARQEQMDTVQYANTTLVERLLPVLDDFHRIVEHAPPGVDDSWLKGIQLTLQHLDEVLEGIGVSRIAAVGEPFDPKVHEAIGSVESAEHPDDTVVDQLRAGYRLHDRVIRPALVRVSRKP